MFYHALTGNGGDTPEPIVDNRTFIIKDGVVQDGFEIQTNGATVTYNSELGMLLVHCTTNSTLGSVYFNTDLTNYNTVCRLTKNLNDRTGNWNTSSRFTVISDSIVNLTNHGDIAGKADSEYANVKELSGSKYIYITNYAGSTDGTYDYYIKDLWLE